MNDPGELGRYYRALVESSADAIITQSSAGIIRSWNPAAERIFGYAAEEIIGRPVTLLFPADRRHEEDMVLARLGQGQRIEHFETVGVRNDGTPIDIAATLSPIVDDAGQIIGVSTIARDITAAKQAETAIRHQETLLRATLASIGDAVIATDAQDRITFMNPLAETLTGWRTAEVRGAPLARAFHVLDEDSGAPAETPMAETVRAGTGRLAGHLVLIARDGTRRPLDASVSPIRDDAGRLFGAVMVFRDATPQQDIEAIRRRLTAIIQSSDDAIVTKSLAGIITSWNPGAERIFGYLAHEVLGRPITILFPPDRLSEEAEFLRRLARGQHVDHFQTVRVRKDGRQVHISVTLSPIKDEAGNVVGISKIARDVTDQVASSQRERAARQEAEEANRIKDEFLTTLSHELRTPLSAVYGWARMLRRGPLNPDSLERGLEVIERNCRAQIEMLTDLLDLSRMRRGSERLSLRPVDLADVVRAATEVVQPAAAAKEVALDLQMTSARVNGDPDRLQQVFWNLLSNAVKFTPKGGRVAVRIGREESDVSVVVQDTGVGISAEALPSVFEAFRQVDSSFTRRYGGLGLGLAIVRQLVELHGGTVRAESKGIGQGATFTVTLPGESAAPSPAVFAPGRAAQAALSAGGPPRLDGITVLVVDDDADTRGLLSHVLQDAGAAVTVAASVAEAMSRLAQDTPDVVITDIGMPDDDGFALLQAIRAIKRTLVPVAALTAYGTDPDRRRIMSAGFDEYVVKPVDPVDLLRLVARLHATHAPPR
jgi:PAS domain S-box-containing protein